MADETVNKHSGKQDTSDYSASHAPDTQNEASEEKTTVDPRMIPGGTLGSAADVGMSGMEREDVPSAAAKPAQLNIAESPKSRV